MESKDHLNSMAREVLGESPAVRIEFVKRAAWYGYPTAIAALTALEVAYSQPASTRVQHLQITGDTNNGKTSVLEEFANSKGAPFPEQGDMAVLQMVAPTSADEKRLWVALLTALGGAFQYRDPAELLFQRVVTLIRNRNVRMLILDEFHESFQGSPAQRRQLLSSIKRLGNVVQIPVVVAGMPYLSGFLNADPQVSNRFQHISLPTWQLDDAFQDLIENVESGVPLPDPSQLWMPIPVEVIFRKTEGLVGEVFAFLRLAATTAIERDERSISTELMENLPWTPPSERRGLTG